jgi:hypothetical protein
MEAEDLSAGCLDVFVVCFYDLLAMRILCVC